MKNLLIYISFCIILIHASDQARLRRRHSESDSGLNVAVDSNPLSPNDAREGSEKFDEGSNDMSVDLNSDPLSRNDGHDRPDNLSIAAESDYPKIKQNDLDVFSNQQTHDGEFLIVPNDEDMDDLIWVMRPPSQHQYGSPHHSGCGCNNDLARNLILGSLGVGAGALAGAGIGSMVGGRKRKSNKNFVPQYHHNSYSDFGKR
ncbi:hypothetical protein Ciccas_008705 [Cichlidogyrus casuarinus]|uniref:Uncharacterized protein n=1 Tax=Cichlidogyrus casuarinus TaxID=1844966 RepID=A0ABD2PZQ2_9PLAT